MTSTRTAKDSKDSTVAGPVDKDGKSITPLITDRLQGVPLDRCHRALYCQLHEDPAIMAQIGPTLSPAQASRSFDAVLKGGRNNSRFYWAFQTTSNQSFAVAGLAIEAPAQAQIGCLLLAEFHGKGFATQMLGAITRYAFTRLKLQTITSFSCVGNIASDILMQKLGYRRAPLADLPNGLGEGYSWRLTKLEWAQHNAADIET